MLDTTPAQGCAGGAAAGATTAAIGGGFAIGSCIATFFFPPAAGLYGAGIASVAGVAVGATAGSTVVGCASGAASAAAQSPTCVPGDASVMLQSGRPRMMQDLAVGDKVAVMAGNGRIKHDAAYAWGHQDPSPVAPFTELTVAMPELLHQTHTISMSAMHFIPTTSGQGTPLEYKCAQDVMLGNYVWAMIHNTTANSVLTLYIVQGTRQVVRQGLYNPLTLSGTILVDGVAASVHSEWFLDSAFDTIGITAWLPAAYQAVLAPARVPYYVLGERTYLQLFWFLDARLGGLDTFCTKHGGAIATAATATALLMLRSFFKKASVKLRCEL